MTNVFSVKANKYNVNLKDKFTSYVIVLSHFVRVEKAEIPI